MNVKLIQGLLAATVLLIIVCVMKSENRMRTVPNVSFKLNRNINNSNPRKQELMHVFSNSEVPGWKWGNVYGGGGGASSA